MSRKHTERLMLAAVLSALTVVLSFLEGLLPPLPIPGAKLGLANVTVMYALCGISLPCAAGVTVVKAAFALFRGPIACLMSTVGSLLSLIVMALTHRFLGDKLSFVGLGVVGAVAHNMGQWMVSYVLLGSAMTYYAPLLLLLAIPAGAVTGLVLNVVYPYLQHNSLFRKG
ncbi:MAG: Gx transporter family protein [Clostridia bacterium]|nr:Gx transporter family protein [Clostridia bacterium]